MRSPGRLILVCSVALAAPILVAMVTGRVWVLGDLLAFHLPLRFLYHQALHAGTSWLWSSSLFSGFYLHGEGQAGMAHPMHLLLYRLLPLGLAFNLEWAASYIAAFAGMWVLLRRLRLSAESALFGAMLFAFCGFNLQHLDHPNEVAVIAHLPWLLCATIGLQSPTSSRSRALAFASVVLLLASAWLLGSPQFVWMVLLAGVLFALHGFRQGAGVGLLLWIGAAGLGCLAGALQWLPMLDAADASVRETPSMAFRLSYSLDPINLVQFWSPYTFVAGYAGPPAERGFEFGAYAGAFGFVSLAWLAARWRALEHRRLAAACLALAGLALLLALGSYGGLYVWLAHVPGLSRFRAPARHLVLLHFALAGTAAIAFHDLAQIVRRPDARVTSRAWPLAIPVALSVMTVAAGAWLQGTSWAAAHGLVLNGAAIAARGSAIVAATAGLTYLAGRGSRASLAMLVVLAAFDLGLWGYQKIRDVSLVPLEAAVSLVDTPPDARPGEAIMPIPDTGLRDLVVLRGLRLAGGYAGLPPRTTFDPANVLAARVAGVVWRRTADGWMRVPDTMPRVRLVADVRASIDIAGDAAIVDIAHTALVREAIAGLSGPPGDARVVTDSPGFIEVETMAPARQLLVLTERFHEGWHAADGSLACPTLPVYGDYLGCLVEPGRHRISFTFSPSSFRRGLMLSGLGLLLTAISAALLWRGWWAAI